MKIFIDKEPVNGPWGGGNKFVSTLKQTLLDFGHDVCHSLESGIDIIFCFDPRPNNHGLWYKNYIEYKRQATSCKIIQRVGDVGTHGKPELTRLVKQSTSYSDFIIFPSVWAKDMIGFNKLNYEIVFNAPKSQFYSQRPEYRELPNSELKIITHHWSTNQKKGFEYYQYIDDIISKIDNVSFTYIGRLPKGLAFKNSIYIQATGDENILSKRIAESDIYLTASIEEAGANHVLEAMACGLPIVYHKNGGSIVEYCRGNGLSFGNKKEMVESINNIKNNYSKFAKNVLKYDNTIEQVISRYVEIICGAH